MVGILLIGGKAPALKAAERVLNRADYIAAADSGFDLALEYGIDPDIVVGDMDSIKNRKAYESISPERKLVYPEDKDDTDTEIGIRILREAGCTETIILGGGEGRLDHSLGILALFEREKSPDLWLTGLESIMKLETETAIESFPGQHISLFPLGTEECTMISEGLEWELDGLRWQRGDFGLSNRALGKTVKITVLTGKLLMLTELLGGR